MSDDLPHNGALDSALKPRVIQASRTPGLVWFYGLWIVIASISGALGHSTLSMPAAIFILGGIISTNFMFLMVAYTEPNTPNMNRLFSRWV